MKTPRTRIASTIAGHALKSGFSKEYADDIAAYLLSERRVSELPSLLRDIQEDWAQSGHVEAVAYSAHPLTADMRGEITAQINKLYPAAKKIIVSEARDPALIGGVRISLPNQQLDLSIENKLNKLKGLTI